MTSLFTSHFLLPLTLTLLSLSTLANAFYSPSDKVQDLTPSNFDSVVKQSKGLTLVEFYAPWCGHCQALAPEYRKAASILNGIVTVAAVDMDKYPQLGQPYGIQGFPTIKLFVGKSVIDYGEQRTANAIVEFAMLKVQALVNKRMAGKAGKSSSSTKDSSSSSSSAVVQLNSSNFQSKVLDSEELVLVEFFAPWCGHCKNLAPHWEKAAKELKSVKGVKLAAIDATVHTNLAAKYEVKGYPTIKVFKPGKKHSPEDYMGGRTSSDIVTYAKNIAESLVVLPPAQVVELTDEVVLQQYCNSTDSSRNLCIVAFLPHILDSKAKGRNAYINTLKAVSKNNARKPFNYLWLEAAAQPALESTLNLNTAFYPAVSVLNMRKQRYSNMVGSFSETGLEEFMSAILTGMEKTHELVTDNVKIESRTQWDGKDGKLEIEEDTEDSNESEGANEKEEPTHSEL